MHNKIGTELKEYRSRLLAVPLLALIVFASAFLFLTPRDFRVDAQYINGILASSSILFGFWVLIVERKNSKEKYRLFLYRELVPSAFFTAFAILIFSVALVYLQALDQIPSVVTLFFVTIDFFFNAWLVALTIYYYELNPWPLHNPLSVLHFRRSYLLKFLRPSYSRW